MKIFPAIDLSEGCAVRLLKGDYAQKTVYSDDPVSVAKGFREAGGEILVISQFTLYGNCKKGRRPDFLSAARPEIAIPLYESFVARCAANGFHVETGEFGADMKVDSLNDGPLTLILDTDQL